MGRNIFRKWLSGVTLASLLINSLLPYNLVGIAHAGELTLPTVEEITIPSEALLPLESPSISPIPLPTTTPDPITTTPSATPTPTNLPSPSPSIDPSPTSTSSATPEATPTPSPSASPTTDTTPTPSTDLTVASQEKTPLRKEGDFLKEKKEGKKNYVEGEVIVKFRRNKLDVARVLGSIQAYAFEKKYSLDREYEFKDLNIRVFRSKKSTEEMVRELESDPNVEYVEPNYLRFPTTISTNDTYKNLLWGLDNTGQTVEGTYNVHTGTDDADIDAPEAWGISEGNGTIVAVISSGVAYNHPDLVNNMWDGTNCKAENGNALGGCNSGYDFEDNDKIPLPATSSHGTHIAGTIAATKNNGKGTIGVAPSTKIMAIKYDSTVATEIKAVDFAIQNGAKIINAGFAGTGFSISEYEAINRFRTAGGIFVTVAGNDSSNNESVHNYPSDYDLDNIISVAATDQNDSLATFSNYGVISVDVGAPGTNIYSTVADSESFSENFEGSSYNIEFDGATTSHWVIGNDGSSKVAYSDKTVPYEADAWTWMMSTNTVDLSNSNIKGATLDFTIWCDTPPAPVYWQDYIETQHYSNGAWSFSSLYDEDQIKYDKGSPWTDSGHEGYYKNYTEDISDHLSDDFAFAFIWSTDPSIDSNLGCTIDDIEITKYSDGSDEKYDYKNGTSMAAPHVAGLAGLIWSYQPELPFSQVKDVILSTGDPLTDLAGKTVTGRRINAHEALLSLEAPTITGLSDDLTPTQSKTWNWGSNDATDKFRYLIDQTEDSVPSGEYDDVKTAMQPDGDGVYYIHVQAKSDTEVESSVTTVSAILDNTASTIEITSPLTGSKVNGDAVITFTNSESVTPQCSINNEDWTSCINGTTTLAGVVGFNELPEGTLNLYVRDTDVAGNTGNDTETGIIKDITAPTGSVTSPVDGSILAIAPVFTASANDENGIVSVKFQYKASSADVYTNLNTDESEPYEADWTGVNLVTNTSYVLQIIITDTAGNSTAVSGVSFTYDTTLPTGLIVINDNDVYTNSRDVTLSFSDVSPDVVQMKLGNGETGSYQSEISYENPHGYTLPDKGDGTYFVRARFIDRAGNESSGVIKDGIILDSTSPVTTDSTDSQWHNANVTVNLNCDDGDGSGCVSTYYTTDGSTPNTNSPSGDLITLTTDGVYTIKYFSIDNIGNTESVKTAANTVKIDKTLPSDPVLSSSHEAFSWSNDNTIDISWNEPHDNLSGIAGYSYLWDTFATTLPDTVSEGINTSVSSPALADGASHYFHLRTVDNAGNWTSTVRLGPFFIDTVAPEITTYILDNPTISPEVSSGIKDTVTINLAFSESVDYIISIRNSANLIVESWSNSSVNSLTEVWNGKDLFGAYVEDGAYTIEVEITDRADNFVTDSSKTITVNNDPLTLNPIGDKNVDEETELTFTAVASNDEGGAITYSLIDAPEGALINPSTGVFSWTPIEIQGSGNYSFRIKAASGDLEKSEEIAITVNEINQAPIVNNDSLSTNEDTAKTITLSAIDSDLPPNTLTYSIVSNSSHGTVSLSGDEATYAPGADYAGPDLFTFKVNDGTVDSNTATVIVIVNPVNDAPIAGDDSTSVDEDMSLIISKSELLVNDSDVDEDPLYLISVSSPINGSVLIVDDDIKFDPDADFNGEASFEYTISDGSLTATGLVTITVNPINDLPEVAAQSVTVDEDTSTMITLSATDVDGDQLVYLVVTEPSHGFLGNISNNQVSYTPDPDYTGLDSFEFKANDGKANSLPATVSINVIPFNDPPVLDPIGDFSINELEQLTFTASASNPEEETLTFSLDGAPDGATINSSTGVFSWTPNEIQGPGDYTFSVIVSDGAKTDSEEIKVTVNEMNQAPTAENISVSTDEETAKVISLSATDPDLPENTLTYSIVSDPSHGTVSLSGNEVIYTPEFDFNGADLFTFKVNDGTVDSNIATIFITINPVNDAPLAGDDNVSTDEDTLLTIAKSILLANDSDIDGDSLNITDVFNPTHGTVSIEDSNIIFNPAGDFNGAASFEYTISDGNLTDTSTVTVTINPVNDVPTVNSQSVSIDEDTAVTIILSGSDIDGDKLSYALVSNPSNGSLGPVSGNEVIYTPNLNYAGTDSFTFKVSDGALDSNTATISITINPVNDAPVAENDTASVNEDTTLILAKSILLVNDSDIDKDGLSITDVSNSVNGSVSIMDDNVEFIPDTNFNGVASFDYMVSDGTLTDTATVSITVNSVNDAPVANDGSILTSEDTAVTIALSASDIDADPLTYFIETGVSNGVLGDISGNQVSYMPNASFTGSDSFTFKVSDGTVYSNIAAVSITVNPPPVISNEITNTPGETSVTITWITDNPSTSRVIYDTVSHAVLDVVPNYGYANSTVETDTFFKVTFHSVTITGLTSETTYYYRVVSHGSPEVVGDEKSFTTESEKSSDREVVAAVSAPVCTDAKPKSAPILLSAVATGLNEITLTWSGAKDPVTYYLVAFGVKSGEMIYGNPNVGGKDITSYTVKGLSSGITYYFKVRAGNNCMPGDFSNEISTTVYGEVIESEIPEGFTEGVLGVEEEVLGEEIEATATPRLEGFEEAGESVLGRSKVIRVVLWGGAGLAGLILIYLFFFGKRKK